MNSFTLQWLPQRLRQFVRVLVACLVLVSVNPSMQHGAASQGDSQQWQQSFYALACESDFGPISLRDSAFPPQGCRPLPDATLQLSTLEGALVATCDTDLSGWCQLSGWSSVPYTVELTAEEIPSGYVSRANPRLYRRDSAVGGGIVVMPSGAEAVDPTGAVLTIHWRVCPDAYEGNDLYGTCHALTPSTAQVWELSGPTVITTPTDAAGNLTVNSLLPGDWTVWTYLPLGDRFRDAFCSSAETPGVRTDRIALVSDPETEGAIRLSGELRGGDAFICDVYLTPYTAHGHEP